MDNETLKKLEDLHTLLLEKEMMVCRGIANSQDDPYFSGFYNGAFIWINFTRLKLKNILPLELPRELRKKFKCPQCASSAFGSSLVSRHPDVWKRFCHGGCCNFTWLDSEDDKYFVET